MIVYEMLIRSEVGMNNEIHYLSWIERGREMQEVSCSLTDELMRN